jgi:hypothetical protein
MYVYCVNSSISESPKQLQLCKATHMFQLAIQPKLTEIRHLDEQGKTITV